MGKKSKGSAGAGGGQTEIEGCGGGTAEAASGAIVASKKTRKCVRCFGTVKNGRLLSWLFSDVLLAVREEGLYGVLERTLAS